MATSTSKAAITRAGESQSSASHRAVRMAQSSGPTEAPDVTANGTPSSPLGASRSCSRAVRSSQSAQFSARAARSSIAGSDMEVICTERIEHAFVLALFSRMRRWSLDLRLTIQRKCRFCLCQSFWTDGQCPSVESTDGRRTGTFTRFAKHIAKVLPVAACSHTKPSYTPAGRRCNDANPVERPARGPGATSACPCP